MNENKEIEEMAKVMCTYCHDITEEKECPYTDEESERCYNSQLDIAKRIYNAGYRKLPKDKVVLTGREYQKYCAYKIVEPQIKGCLDRERKLERTVENLRANIKRNDEHLHIRIKEQASKETAEKILNELFTTHNVFNDNDVLVIWQLKDILKELAKQFGVEIKEN